MLKGSKCSQWISSFILVLLLAVVNAYSQAQRIRIVVENASVRSQPNLTADIIKKPPLGSVFEVEKKQGEWYEIRVKTELGMSVSAYIHEMFVQVMGEIPKPKKVEDKPTPPPEKTKRTPPLPAPKQDTPKAPETTGKPEPPRLDLAVLGGLVSASFLNERTGYSDNWTEDLLDLVNESGTIHHKLNKPSGFGASLSYFLLGGLGIQIRYDAVSKMSIESQEPGSVYQISWSWTTTTDTFSNEESWPVSGEMTLSPVSLNLIYKVRSGGFLAPYVSAGISYFSGSFKTDSTRGFGFSYEEGTFQRIEHLSLPVSVDASLSGIGFNVGGGIDLRILRSVALTIDAAYFIKSGADERWQVAAGSYPGNNFPEISWNIDQELAGLISEELPALKITPSFLKLQGGVKFSF